MSSGLRWKDFSNSKDASIAFHWTNSGKSISQSHKSHLIPYYFCSLLFLPILFVYLSVKKIRTAKANVLFGVLKGPSHLLQLMKRNAGRKKNLGLWIAGECNECNTFDARLMTALKLQPIYLISYYTLLVRIKNLQLTDLFEITGSRHWK